MVGNKILELLLLALLLFSVVLLFIQNIRQKNRIKKLENNSHRRSVYDIHVGERK